jgi:hypothetical protein
VVIDVTPYSLNEGADDLRSQRNDDTVLLKNDAVNCVDVVSKGTEWGKKVMFYIREARLCNP